MNIKMFTFDGILYTQIGDSYFTINGIRSDGTIEVLQCAHDIPTGNIADDHMVVRNGYRIIKPLDIESNGMITVGEIKRIYIDNIGEICDPFAWHYYSDLLPQWHNRILIIPLLGVQA